MSTGIMKTCKNSDNWVWCALALNLLVCLAVAAEYALQLGSASIAADTLLAVWPGLLTGPLLALLFRRIGYSTPSRGLFWGVFFGLTDALVSTLLCFLWVALATLPGKYHCPPWCASGDGVGIVYATITDLATKAIVPVVLTLWIAVIGGAIIGIGQMRA
jgi:hypothetical protein